MPLCELWTLTTGSGGVKNQGLFSCQFFLKLILTAQSCNFAFPATRLEASLGLRSPGPDDEDQGRIDKPRTYIY